MIRWHGRTVWSEACPEVRFMRISGNFYEVENGVNH